MKKYYLDIIEQMGFGMADKDQRYVSLYDENLIGKIDTVKGSFYYKDIDGREILIDKKNTSKFALCGFYIYAYNLYENDLLSLSINSQKSGNQLGISITKKPLCVNAESADSVAEVNIWSLNKNDQFITEEYFFRVFSNTCEFYLIKYGHGEFSEKISLEDCTIENIICHIMGYLQTTKWADDMDVQNGFNLVLPVLMNGISDMLEYCKGYISGTVK